MCTSIIRGVFYFGPQCKQLPSKTARDWQGSGHSSFKKVVSISPDSTYPARRFVYAFGILGVCLFSQIPTLSPFFRLGFFHFSQCRLFFSPAEVICGLQRRACLCPVNIDVVVRIIWKIYTSSRWSLSRSTHSISVYLCRCAASMNGKDTRRYLSLGGDPDNLSRGKQTNGNLGHFPMPLIGLGNCTQNCRNRSGPGIRYQCGHWLVFCLVHCSAAIFLLYLPIPELFPVTADRGTLTDRTAER